MTKTPAGIARRLLFLIILTYTMLALAYAYLTPLWQNPDEPAHYNYAREITDHVRLPILGPGDYDQQALEQLKVSKFSGNPDVSRIRYESYQPPLYYLLGAGVIALTPGVDFDLYAMRLLSVALGALVIIVIFVIAREVVGEDRLVALGAAGLVAFIPQHMAIAAAANNDALGELLLALLAIRRMKGLAVRRFVIAGAVLFGLALLTKLSAYVGVGLLAAGEFGHWWLIDQRRTRFPLLVGLGVAGGALLISGWWFVRNALVYGNLDVMGLARHGEVVVGQPRTLWSLDALQHLVVTTFQSFWGIFGWMGVLLDVRIYWLLALLTLMAVVGLAVFFARTVQCFCPWQRWALAILALQLLFMVGVLVYYNLTFIQPQGRYLFPASAAIGVFLALGLREMIDRPAVLAGLSAAGCLVCFLAVRGWFVLGIGLLVVVMIAGAWLFARRCYHLLLRGGLLGALAVLDLVSLLLFIVPALTS